MELDERDLDGYTAYGFYPDENCVQPQDELDLLPEFCQYRDEGCELAESCLGCPYPKCMHDGESGRRRLLKAVRDREMVRLFRAGNTSLKELAKRFKVSKRTVQRALAKRGKGVINQ